MHLVTSLGTFDNLPEFFEAMRQRDTKEVQPIEHVCPCGNKHWELGRLCSYCKRGC